MAKLEFKLDSRIPEEAALMERLHELPKDRHIEYMRNLALKAFTQERVESRQHSRELTASVSDRTSDNQAPSPRLSKPNRQRLKPNASAQEPKAPGDLTLASLRHIVG